MNAIARAQADAARSWLNREIAAGRLAGSPSPELLRRVATSIVASGVTSNGAHPRASEKRNRRGENNTAAMHGGQAHGPTTG